MRETVIVEAVRTPSASATADCRAMHAADLSALVLNELVDAPASTPTSSTTWSGAACPRSATSRAISAATRCWPPAGRRRIPGTTVNRACGSSQQALDFAVQAVMSGQQDVVVAGGVEVMSRVPLGSAQGHRHALRAESACALRRLLVQPGHLRRDDRREVGLFPHPPRRVLRACRTSGPRPPRTRGLRRRRSSRCSPTATRWCADEGVRRGTTVEKLAGLKPAFTDDGVIHAGNSSQISDGAAALLVTTAENAVAAGPDARSCATAPARSPGADPVLMLTGPIPATEKVLHKAGVGLDEVGVFEVNEAFAPVPLAWLAETGADEERLNPLGGAIALGHPLGASGAVLMTRMVHHMRDNGIRYGLQTMCEGGGTANATLVELRRDLRREEDVAVRRRLCSPRTTRRSASWPGTSSRRRSSPHYPEWEKAGRMPREVFEHMGATRHAGHGDPRGVRRGGHPRLPLQRGPAGGGGARPGHPVHGAHPARRDPAVLPALRER